LDVTLLQKYVLAPLFGIDDRARAAHQFCRRHSRTGELKNSEDVNMPARSPCSPEHRGLDDHRDAGGIMPPKSTWFEPSSATSMFCH